MSGWIVVHHYLPNGTRGAEALVNIDNLSAVQSVAGGVRSMLIWQTSSPRASWDVVEPYAEIVDAIGWEHQA